MSEFDLALAELATADVKLADSYPYAAWLGAYLRLQRPDWWERFAGECAQAALPLPQAADYAFLQYCENVAAWADVCALLLRQYFKQAPPAQQQELLNTCEWYLAPEAEAVTRSPISGDLPH